MLCVGTQTRGRIESRFDLQVVGPGIHTLQPQRSSWVKVKVTHPNGKEVKLNEWGVWTHYGPNLHENFLNKQLVLNGFTPDRDRRGAHVRIHNNSTRFKELKPGTRLGNVRVDRWE